MRKSKKKYISDLPELVSQWHPTKNGSISPSEITVTNHIKIWWKCDKGDDHEWQTNANNRVRHGSGCPFCAGQRATSLNNLTVTRPELIEIWDYEVNSKLPTELMPSSNYKASFKCSNNPSHKWEQKLSNKNIECPDCFAKNKSVFGVASHLIDEWDIEENERLGLDPRKVSAGSAKKAAWVCTHNSSHKWKVNIRNRAVLNSGCPYCAGHIATQESNLMVGFPEVANEWHPTKNKKVKSTDVKAGSGIKRWWLCPKGHSYQATPDSRTGKKGTGCPKCNSSTSSPEIRIFCELSSLFPEAKQRAKVYGVELDIWLPHLNLGVEFDGFYWHKDKLAKDKQKNQVLIKEGIKLIRVRVKPLDKISEHDILCERDDLTKADINSLLLSMYRIKLISKKQLLEYEKQSDFCNDIEYRRILSYLPSPVPEESLGTVTAESLTYWDYKLNSPLVPDNFAPKSNKVVHWRCKIDPSHKWEMRINEFSKNKKCPFCAKTRPSATYSLKTEHPELASEWHPTKNTITPEEILPKSGVKVWWFCKEDASHEWQVSPNSRVYFSNGCPICSGRVASEKNNFAKTHPHLLQSWDYSKNDGDPRDFKSGSSVVVHWICPDYEYHRWESSIYSRVNNKCPFCSGKRAHVLDSVKHNSPEILKEFLYFISKDDVKISLEDLPTRSSRRAKWQCKICNHKYSLSVKDKIKGESCSKCYPKYTNGTLASKRPELAAEWHPSKNERTPEQITILSNTTEFWWLCENGHEWRKSLLARTSREVQCTVCEEIETKKLFKTEALKYQTRWEFQKSSRNVYMRAHSKGWLDELCVHMISVRKPPGYWKYETCREEAQKYEGRTAFKRGNRMAYKVSLENKWMDEFFPSK